LNPFKSLEDYPRRRSFICNFCPFLMNFP